MPIKRTHSGGRTKAVGSAFSFFLGFVLCLSTIMLISRLSATSKSITTSKHDTLNRFVWIKNITATKPRHSKRLQLSVQERPDATASPKHAHEEDDDEKEPEKRIKTKSSTARGVLSGSSKKKKIDRIVASGVTERERLTGGAEEPAGEEVPAGEGGPGEEKEEDGVLDLVELKRISGRLMRRGKLIAATLANWSFREMLENWVVHVRKCGMGDLILVATFDNATHTWCKNQGIESVLLRTSLGEADFRGTIQFRDMGSPKAWFLLHLLKLGHNVLMSDTDTAWMKDPRKYLMKDPEVRGADVLVTSDSISHRHDVASMKADSREAEWYQGLSEHPGEMFATTYDNSLNTGVLVFRPTPSSIAFVETWYQSLLTVGASEGWDMVYDDQDAFNRLMHNEFWPVQVVRDKGQPVSNRVVWAFRKSIKLALLPPLTFCNGHVFFVQRTPQSLGVRPFVVHNTFQFYFTAGKKIRFMEAHLWALEPASYYEQGNFLSFDVQLPQSFHKANFSDVTRHIAAIQFYFLSIRNALAIASSLDRALILPKLTCYCDRYWQNLEPECRFPGTDLEAPYLCPPDHVINPWNWFNSEVKFRVHTFLDHPRVPKSIRNSRLNVSVLPRATLDKCKTPPCLGQGSTDAEVATALARHADIRVLHLSSAYDAFSRFEEEQDSKEFEDRNNYFGLFGPEDWCCLSGMHKDEAEAHKKFYPPVPIIGEDRFLSTRWPNITFDWRDVERGFASHLIGAQTSASVNQSLTL